MGLAGFNLRRREQTKKEKEAKVDYDSLTLNDLKQIAKEKNVNNYSNMKKDDLIAELRKIEGAR
ncbi:Rho termination factor N-terminal domain-containing protein [Clostridium guangxiense]|uniref:Rho termination factor N-terminal domain-containing protein n=1 Tax=Clostridium guangxiense TaxID=1662055 RepID=UPI001E390612|nr:Rho termination factor N-terminal domain-containing protein [Clostridium guangxiense]MCD2345811.1 Rho termination factor N-terminal domain-containing protein [Clostridium guangxiense]